MAPARPLAVDGVRRRRADQGARCCCELAATFGQLLVRGGNRVGAIVYDGERQWTIPPRQGRNQVLALVRELLRPVERRHRDRPDQAASTTAARLVRRRSLVVLISDFISEPGWDRSLLRLTERHEVVAVRLVDPREYELPDAGLLFVQDAETGEQLLVDSSDPELRRRLLAAADEQDEAIRRAVSRGPGSTSTSCRPRTTCCSAFVRMAGPRRPARR